MIKFRSTGSKEKPTGTPSSHRLNPEEGLARASALEETKSSAVGRRTSENLHPCLFLLFVAGLLTVFISFGLLLAPRAGLEEDEVMFISNLWHPGQSRASVSILHRRMPLMMMSYLGALKSWIFAPVFRVWGVSEWSVRVPALLLAVATMVFGGFLMRRISGRLAASIFICLLSTDITFLVTAVFDWGPVVIQNLLLVAGILAFSKWGSEKRNWMLFAGGLLFGLALWDKALFIWNLSGMIVALLLVYPKALIREFRWTRAGLAVSGLVIGACPLLWFNLTHSAATLKDNTHLSLQEVVRKADYVKLSLDGTLPQYPFADDRYQIPDRDTSWLGGALRALTPAKPQRIASWRPSIFVVVILAGLPFARKAPRRWILFLLISTIAAWFESAVTVGAGESLHHTVLVWPLVYGAVALSASAIAQGRGKFTATAVLLIVGILSVRGIQMLGFTYLNMLSSARVTQWTDADKPLGELLRRQAVRRAIIVDWGIADIVAARTADKVAEFDEYFALAGGHFDRDKFVNCHAPDCVVISHVKERAMDPKTNALLENFFHNLHLTKIDLSVVSDGHGIPTFELFRVRPDPVKAALDSGRSGSKTNEYERPSEDITRLPHQHE